MSHKMTVFSLLGRQGKSLCPSVCVCGRKNSISLIPILFVSVLTMTACKKVHQLPYQSNTGRMLQVELMMPEPWKKIIIGPSKSIEYPQIPQWFSVFMTGESTGALKPYLLIKDSTGKECSIYFITVTHANKGQTET